MSMPVFPAPSRIEKGEGVFAFGDRVCLRIAPESLTYDQRDLLRLLWFQHCAAACCLEILPLPGLPAHTARIGEARDQPLEAGDAYALRVTPDGVSLAGSDNQGLLYALFTLLQSIDPTCLAEERASFAIACAEIHDRPALRVRGLHLCVFPETTPLLLEKAIRMAGFLKMNLLVLEFWGVFPFKALPELCWAGHSFDLGALRSLLSLARSLGMEVAPMFNHLGHASQSRAGAGRHAVLDQNPRRALLFEPDGWTWCLGNPEVHKILRACREELTCFFGPGQYFHLGCDESYSYATCPLCAGQDSVRRLADFLCGLAAELDGQGRRGVIWADQLLETAAWPHPAIATSGPDQRTHEALDLLDRRLILADWQYNITTPELPTARHFMDKGFDVWACPWDAKGNGAALAAAMDSMGGQGFLATTWHRLAPMLHQMPSLGGSAWGGAAHLDRAWQHISAAALLRKIMPPAATFERAGFMPKETDADAIRTIG